MKDRQGHEVSRELVHCTVRSTASFLPGRPARWSYGHGALRRCFSAAVAGVAMSIMAIVKQKRRLEKLRERSELRRQALEKQVDSWFEKFDDDGES